MTNSWYEQVDHLTALTQGDIILECPILLFKSDIAITGTDDHRQQLEAGVRGVSCDVIVMTQACDLHNKKVDNVILCPHNSG